MTALEAPSQPQAESREPAPAASLIQKTGWSALAACGIVIARFAVTVFTARHLGPAGAGRLAYLLWIQEMVATVTGFGMLSCVTRFVAELTGRGRLEAAESLSCWLHRRYLALTVVGGIGIAVVAAPPWRAAGGAQTWAALGLCLVCQSMGAFYTAYLAGRQQFDKMARVNLISGAVLVVCAAAGVELWGVTGTLIGYAAGSLFPALLSCKLLRGGRPLDRGAAATCIKYSCFAWCAALVSACVWSRVEVVFLERYWGNHEVAMFSIGLTLAALAIQAPMLLGSALMPHFAESAGARPAGTERHLYSRALRLFAALLFPLCLGTSSLIPTLLPAVYGGAFRAAIPSAMMLTAFSILALMNVGSSLVYASGRAWFVAASGMSGAILSLAGCAVVIPVWGVWGASLSRSAVQTAMAALGTWYIHRHLGCPAPLRALGKILAAALVAALFSYSVILLVPAILSLAIAIPGAALVYVVMLRLTSALDSGDAQILHHAAAWSPAMVSVPLRSVLGWVAR